MPARNTCGRSTINGDANVLSTASWAPGLDAADIPVVAISVGERNCRVSTQAHWVGHLALELLHERRIRRNYDFIDRPGLLHAVRKMPSTNDPMEAHYTLAHCTWKR